MEKKKNFRGKSLPQGLILTADACILTQCDTRKQYYKTTKCYHKRPIQHCRAFYKVQSLFKRFCCNSELRGFTVDLDVVCALNRHYCPCFLLLLLFTVQLTFEAGVPLNLTM